MVTINVLVIIAMCISGYSGYVSPNDHPLISISNLAFPIFVGLNLAFLVFWIIFRWRLLLIPVVGLLVCYQPIRQYWPLNREDEIPDNCLKVMSYNVHMYGIFDKDRKFKEEIVDYIKQSGADIVCIQESFHRKYKDANVEECYADVYPYYEWTQLKREQSSHFLYSKYPILSKEIIPIESEGNMSEAYLLDIDGDTVLLVNNHLETYGFSQEDKQMYEEIVEGNTQEYAEKSLLGKVIKATKIRARQAETIAAFLKKHRDMPIIVCGDFNDTPLSYVHHTIGKGLTDTYVATGRGPGFSYVNNNMYERIDHIFCSEHFVPYYTVVDNKISFSDHYPIISVLKKRPKD